MYGPPVEENNRLRGVIAGAQPARVATEWLNYHHLYYFWRTARGGSLTAAARELKLSHSTLSIQIRELADRMGEPLFERRGRQLVLTPFGENVASYADDIFRLGGELAELAQGRGAGGRQMPVRVGTVSSMPRSLVYNLIQPALESVEAPLIFRQDNVLRLVEDLAANRLHVVLADAPPPEAVRARIFAHELGHSGLLLYAVPKLARRLRPGFPGSLADVPFLLPIAGSPQRRLIDRWLLRHKLTPRVAAEFEDAGLLRVFGGKGLGVFPVRMALRAEVESMFECEMIGQLRGVEESYYALSVERRARHPFVAALIATARAELKNRAKLPEG